MDLRRGRDVERNKSELYTGDVYARVFFRGAVVRELHVE